MSPTTTATDPEPPRHELPTQVPPDPRRPLTPEEHRDALLTTVYHATRCQNPKCRTSTVPTSGPPNTTDFPNWPRMDTARCRVCLNGFAKQFRLVGPEAVDAFGAETARVVREQKDAAKAVAAAADRQRAKADAALKPQAARSARATAKPLGKAAAGKGSAQ